MTTENLYKEAPCRKCGKMKLKSSSFCPHCGHVQEEGWLDRIRDRFGAGGGASFSLSTVIAAVVLIGAVILAVDAIADGRYSDLITIAVLVLVSLRAFYRMRGQTERADAGSKPATRERSDSLTETDDLATHYACENCGTQVAADAKECPKCGTRFA